MSVVTRTGDGGSTALFGGRRISKSSPRLHAYGTVDELNAVLGVILAEKGLPEHIKEHLFATQSLLFRVGTDLATPLSGNVEVVRIAKGETVQVEEWIEELEQALPTLKRFILPSGSKLGALLHQARTVCRRAERYVVEMMEKEEGNEHVQIYLNRLSDYLFLAARAVNRAAGAEEQEV